MRIPDAYRPLPTSTDAAESRPVREGAQGRTAPTSTAAPPSTDTPSVTVKVSDKARELSSAASDASAAKVANLQRAVANGTFQIDPQAIADRLVQGD